MEVLTAQLDILVRNTISIVSLFILALIMGKRLISELNFLDFIVGITIGSIAASLSIDRTISISHGIFSLIIWGLIPILIFKVTLNNDHARRLFDGTSVVVIEKGKILEENLKKEKYNVNNLIEELRLGGVFDISDVESAILETNGRLSIQLKAEKLPVTKQDLNIAVKQQGLFANVIMDGKILNEQLRLIDRNERWLLSEINNRNIRVEDIVLASVDKQGNLYIDLKEDSTNHH
ncbi:MAG TPA: DUF421 domain-containing protein [Syntrophomonadaceae bacterium]|jgi:uncharacterized membrane protein YcaP (DUF421 family)|nr:DUF421 domain-containing protein [Syntrophomonadaceae bacterium]